MSNIKVIRPYMKVLREEHRRSLQGTLNAEGKTKVPGAREFITPKTDGFGNVLTGMDENAKKFQAMPKDMADELREHAKAKRLRLEAALGVDLSPNSKYWKEIPPYTFLDEDNVFDMSDPEQELAFSWLSEISTMISPSKEEIRSGKRDTCLYYVYSPTEEVEKDFSKKKRVNEAKIKLGQLAETEIRRVQYLMNLNMPASATYSEIYNVIDEYLGEPKTTSKSDPIENFNRILAYDAETLNVKYLVKQLLEFRLVKQVGDSISEGNNTIAKSVQDFEIQLKEPEFFYNWTKKLEEKLNLVKVL